VAKVFRSFSSRRRSLEAETELNIRLLWSFNPFQGEKTFSLSSSENFHFSLPARKNFALLRLRRAKSKYERKVSTLGGAGKGEKGAFVVEVSL
jgi:hypothetical protein